MSRTGLIRVRSLTVERSVWLLRDSDGGTWRLGFNGVDAPMRIRSALARGEQPLATIVFDEDVIQKMT